MKPFKHYCEPKFKGDDILTSNSIMHNNCLCTQCGEEIPLETVIAHIYQQLFEIKPEDKPKKTNDSIGKSRPFNINDIIDYDKHEGKTIKSMIENSCQWVDWSLENLNWFKLDEVTMVHYWKHTDKTHPDKKIKKYPLPPVSDDDELPF